MKVAIMQPYFFPYLGYFSLIKHTDRFILFDTPQFMRKGWIERNRLDKNGEGTVYLKVPLIKAPLDTEIKDMVINNDVDWKSKILSQLTIYKKKAPYYHRVVSLVENCLQDSSSSIVDLNRNVLLGVCSYLGINKEIETFSAMNLDIETPSKPDEWALNICRCIGASTYINAPGGQSFFDKDKYDLANIDLKFVNQPLPEYNQLNSQFKPGLSIIDVLMFNSPEEVNKMLDGATLE